VLQDTQDPRNNCKIYNTGSILNSIIPVLYQSTVTCMHKFRLDYRVTGTESEALAAETDSDGDRERSDSDGDREQSESDGDRERSVGDGDRERSDSDGD
jgi:hypothetical protein